MCVCVCHNIRQNDSSLVYRIKTSGPPGSCRRYRHAGPIPCRSVARHGLSSSSVGYVWLSEATLDVFNLWHLQFHLREPTKIPSLNWKREREQALEDDRKALTEALQLEEEMKSLMQISTLATKTSSSSSSSASPKQSKGNAESSSGLFNWMWSCWS